MITVGVKDLDIVLAVHNDQGALVCTTRMTPWMAKCIAEQLDLAAMAVEKQDDD